MAVVQGPANKNVRVVFITEPSHPAFGQHGLLAARHLKAREFVIDYCGMIEYEAFASKTSDYILQLSDDLSVDGERMGNEARFINDFRGVGKRANLEFCLCPPEPGKEIRMGIFVGSNDIKKGDELLLSYGKGFWQERNLLEKDSLE